MKLTIKVSYFCNTFRSIRVKVIDKNTFGAMDSFLNFLSHPVLKSRLASLQLPGNSVDPLRVLFCAPFATHILKI